jgi:pimeloyl-ACP methyl ester carboxylesterase
MLEKELTLPRMGETMDEGAIVAWLKQPGEHFRRGETLLEVESDKTNVEIPALEDGEMVRHLASVGEKVAVDRPIAVIATAGASSTSSEPVERHYSNSPAVRQWDQPDSNESTRTTANVGRDLREPAPTVNAKIRASPMARRRATKLGVNLAEIKGSGPRGRVTVADVHAHVMLVPKPSIPMVDISGMHALRWGKPERGTCVLLHGFAGDPTNWRRTGEFLASQGFEAIAFELPGHGSRPLAASSLEELAAELLHALPNSSASSLHLVGHSLGGALAISIAAKASDRLTSLTLMAPFGIGTFIDQSFLDGMASVRTVAALEREIRKTTAQPLSYSKTALAAMLQSLPTDSLGAISGMMASNGVQQLFLVPELEKMKLPVRVLFGRQDRILRWQEALNLPGKIALHLFDTGHMLHWEDPSAVLPVLAGFPVGG